MFLAEKAGHSVLIVSVGPYLHKFLASCFLTFLAIDRYIL